MDTAELQVIAKQIRDLAADRTQTTIHVTSLACRLVQEAIRRGAFAGVKHLAFREAVGLACDPDQEKACRTFEAAIRILSRVEPSVPGGSLFRLAVSGSEARGDDGKFFGGRLVAISRWNLANLPPLAGLVEQEMGSGGQGTPSDSLGKGVAPRDAKFLEWYEATGTDTYHKPAKIHAKWEGMSIAQRAEICADCPNKITKAAVSQAIKRALAKRKARPSTKCRRTLRKSP